MMPKSIFNIACLVCLLLFQTNTFAQRNFSLYNMDNTPQAHYMNPAFKPMSNVYISFPLGMQSFGVSHSGFTYQDIIRRKNDTLMELTPATAISKMAKINHINVEAQNEIFGLGLRIKKNYFSFAVMNRTQFNFMYSRDLFKFAFEGNGRDFLGERISLDGLGVNLNSYIEYGLGYNRQWNDKLSVGARFKLLSGIANVHTKKSQLGIHTDAETFDLTIDGSMRVNSSNVMHIANDTTGQNAMNMYEYAYNFKNMGFGIDAGANYKFSDKFSINASVVDLGFINWKTNTQNYVSNDVNYTFKGVDFNGFFQDSTVIFDRLSDSLEQVFSYAENTESYRSSLYTRFYIGGKYELNKKFSLHGMLYNEFVNKRYRPGAIVSANAHLGQWLTASLNYSVYGRSFANVGFGLSLRGGPIQFYIVSDNLLAFMLQTSAKNVHIMTGMGILFGKPDKERKRSARLKENTK
jgi:hypothetical protein